jgi:hypothetical protein
MSLNQKSLFKKGLGCGSSSRVLEAPSSNPSTAKKKKKGKNNNKPLCNKSDYEASKSWVSYFKVVFQKQYNKIICVTP